MKSTKALARDEALAAPLPKALAVPLPKAASTRSNNHTRRPGVELVRCIQNLKTSGGKSVRQCKRFATSGKAKLCKFHLEVVQGIRDPTNNGGPVPTYKDLQQSALTTSMVKKAKSATGYVLNLQARQALDRLHNPAASDPNVDPRLVLLDSVNSAWRQRQVWEAMLASIPDADWERIGEPPLPGSLATSKGARIETISRMLQEATKVAARTSKLAIDAGIEERLVRLAEEQANLIADTVRAGLLVALTALVRDLHLAPAAEARITELAMSEAAKHLRLLASGPTEVIEGVAAAMPDKMVRHESAAGTTYYRPLTKAQREGQNNG